MTDDAFLSNSCYMDHYNNRNKTELQQIFGYLLSRICHINKNAFGIWGSRFKVRNNLDPELTAHFALAFLTLLNML